MWEAEIQGSRFQAGPGKKKKKFGRHHLNRKKESWVWWCMSAIPVTVGSLK
jgi:hypothetical protein